VPPSGDMNQEKARGKNFWGCPIPKKSGGWLYQRGVLGCKTNVHLKGGKKRKNLGAWKNGCRTGREKTPVGSWGGAQPSAGNGPQPVQGKNENPRGGGIERVICPEPIMRKNFGVCAFTKSVVGNRKKVGGSSNSGKVGAAHTCKGQGIKRTEGNQTLRLGALVTCCGAHY